MPTAEEIKERRVKDLLSRALMNESSEQLDRLIKKGYVANIQYRPINENGKPIKEEKDMYRAMTLFEIDELREHANDAHSMVLLMAPSKRRDALLPILEQPSSTLSHCPPVQEPGHVARRQSAIVASPGRL